MLRSWIASGKVVTTVAGGVVVSGLAYGIDTAWYNPDRRPVPADIAITHDVADLAELVDTVLGEREPV